MRCRVKLGLGYVKTLSGPSAAARMGRVRLVKTLSGPSAAARMG